MHMYLRSLGFSQYTSNRAADRFLDELVENYGGGARQIRCYEEDRRWEFRVVLAPGMSLVIGGRFNEQGRLIRDTHYPCLDSDDTSSEVACSIQKQIDKDEYIGLVDDSRVGISLIFRLTNTMEYLDRAFCKLPLFSKEVCLSSWSNKGRILLPVQKKNKAVYQAATQNRYSLIEAARNGDEQAIESLSMEELNMYNMVSRRLQNEDIYSIVDTCFVPHGVECDIYSILGEIEKIDTKKNTITGEEVYDFTLNCNDIRIHTGILKSDLEGEPEVGRRFKGRIWLQGKVKFREALD